MHKNRPSSFIIDDSACFVNQESEVQEKKATATTKPLPLGEVALRSNDGEGKPGTKEPLRSDGQALCQSDAIAASELFGSGLALSVGLTPASSPKGGAIGMSVSFRLDERSTIYRKR